MSKRLKCRPLPHRFIISVRSSVAMGPWGWARGYLRPHPRKMMIAHFVYVSWNLLVSGSILSAKCRLRSLLVISFWTIHASYQSSRSDKLPYWKAIFLSSISPKLMNVDLLISDLSLRAIFRCNLSQLWEGLASQEFTLLVRPNLSVLWPVIERAEWRGDIFICQP